MEDRSYELLKRKIGELLSIDIEAYKAPQMRRRIETFVRRKAGDTEPLLFIRSLSQNEELLAELRDMLTINVSEFFRDSQQWALLRTKLLPELAERNRRLQIWSAGCSAGQEPFSLVILAEELGLTERVQITATDLDRAILARARAGGPYPEAELKGLSREQRERYLTETKGGFHFVDTVRLRPRFAELNLLRDRFRTGYHLICCRHVMIYFSAEIKLQLIAKLHEALAPGGLLFIGGTEALLGEQRIGFELAGGNFYRKLPAAALRAAA